MPKTDATRHVGFSPSPWGFGRDPKLCGTEDGGGGPGDRGT